MSSKFVRLAAGGNRIRTIGPAEKETAVERGPAADHRRLARRPVLNDPQSAYRSGISRRQQPRDLSQERDRWFESGSLQRRVRNEPSAASLGPPNAEWVRRPELCSSYRPAPAGKGRAVKDADVLPVVITSA